MPGSFYHLALPTDQNIYLKKQLVTGSDFCVKYFSVMPGNGDFIGII